MKTRSAAIFLVWASAQAQTTSPPPPITIPLLDPSGNLNIGNTQGTSGGPNGSIFLFSAGGGSVQITVPTSGLRSTVMTLPSPPTAGVNGNVVVDSFNNTFTGVNSFSSSTASVILPNTPAPFTGSTPLGQVAFLTSQQQYTSQGNQSVVGSFPRVISLQVPTGDYLCTDTSLAGCSGHGIGTTATAFATSYTLPANFWCLTRLSGSRLRSRSRRVGRRRRLIFSSLRQRRRNRQ